MKRHIFFTFFIASLFARPLFAMDQSQSKLGWDGAQYDKGSDGQFLAGCWLLDTFLKLEKEATIGELGCGTGRLGVKIARDYVPNGKVIGIDNNSSMINEALRKQNETPISNLTFRLENICDLTFEDNTIDAHISVFCLHWIETIEEMRAAIEGIARTLKPGGKFVAIFNLTDSEECPFILQRVARKIIQSDDWKEYYVENNTEVKVLGNLLTLNDYRRLLTQAGLKADVSVKAPPTRDIPEQERINSILALPFGKAIPEARKNEFIAHTLEMLKNHGMKNTDGTYIQHVPLGIIVAQKPLE